MRGTDTRADPALCRMLDQCHGRLRIHTNGLACKTRRYTVTVPFSRASTLGVYNNSVHTAHRAFVERYFLCKEDEGFRPALTPVRDAYAGEWFQSFRRSVARFMPNLPPLTERQVADTYRGPKFRVYDEACKSLELMSFNRRDAFLKSFVKFEKQKLTGAPRIINPRAARYNLMLGKYLKHAEHHFFKAINQAFGGFTPHTVIKGMNADVAASVIVQKWERFASPVAIGLDATKFDMHVSVQALQYEHSFYMRLYPNRAELRDLLNLQLVNRGRAHFVDGDIEFTMVGTRSSGDLNTSLGNCILMCSAVYAYTKELGIDCELINNGDDCVVIIETRDLTKFNVGLDAWFRARGFAMAVEPPVYELEQIEFCQSHPVQLSSGWRMVRNQSAVFQKDPMCLVPISSDRLFRRWLDAVGECGLHSASGVPIQEAFYKCFHRNAHGIKAGRRFYRHVFANTSRLEFSHGVSRATITPQSRASYWAAFGVLPDEQILVEQQLEHYVINEWKSAEFDHDDLVKFNDAGVEIFTSINHD